jgi:hypothetical protein
VPDASANLDIALERARNVTQNPLLKGNTVSNPQLGAATSLTTKAIYVVLAAAILVFFAMLALTML